MATNGALLKLSMRRNLSPAERYVLDQVIPDLNADVPYPRAVRVVVTDRFDQVVGDYEALIPDNPNPPQKYKAARADGSTAMAKTLPIPNDRIAVVVNVAALGDGRAPARRLVIHEAQHVKLLQHNDQGWTAHRRVGFVLPNDLTWQYIWMAESLIDEYRCELTMHSRGIGYANFAWSDEVYPAIAELMGSATSFFAWIDAVDRLKDFLGYSAAAAASDDATLQAWPASQHVPAVAALLRPMPASETIIGANAIVDVAVVVARYLRDLPGAVQEPRG